VRAMLDWDSLPNGYSLRLVLIRHGEPEPEAKGKCCGILDVGLSDTGRAQIQAKLASVRNLRVAALYASPLKRAVESASIAGACLGLHAIISPELQEINFGRLEGMSFSEIEKLYPQEYRLWMESPTRIKFPEGESFAEMKARVVNFKNSLLNTHQGETVVLVSHGGPNRIMLAEALAIPDEMIFRIDQAYAAVNVIDYFEGYPVVRLVNG
jgi:broad specificity phosphatase PhoE